MITKDFQKIKKDVDSYRTDRIENIIQILLTLLIMFCLIFDVNYVLFLLSLIIFGFLLYDFFFALPNRKRLIKSQLDEYRKAITKMHSSSDLLIERLKILKDDFPRLAKKKNANNVLLYRLILVRSTALRDGYYYEVARGYKEPDTSFTHPMGLAATLRFIKGLIKTAKKRSKRSKEILKEVDKISNYL